MNILIKLSLLPAYIWDAMWAPIYKRAMKHCGKGVYLRPMSSDIKGLENLSVGDGTSIPKGSTIYCTEAPCTIGRKVIFGPKPTIITGDHRIDIIGKHIIDVTVEEKKSRGKEFKGSSGSSGSSGSNGSKGSKGLNELNSLNRSFYDLPVTIGDGCWIGANVTILKGVTIGRGSVVAAGAVVTKSCPPYSIIGGVPAKVIKYRFTVDEVIEHEKALFPENERYSREQLIETRRVGNADTSD